MLDYSPERCARLRATAVRARARGDRETARRELRFAVHLESLRAEVAASAPGGACASGVGSSESVEDAAALDEIVGLVGEARGWYAGHDETGQVTR